MVERYDFSRRDFLKACAAVAVATPFLSYSSPASAQTPIEKQFFVDKNSGVDPTTDDGTYGISAEKPWKSLSHAFTVINGGGTSLPRYVQQAGEPILVNVGPGIYNRWDSSSPDHDFFLFGQTPNQYIRGTYEVPAWAKVVLSPNNPNVETRFTSIDMTYGGELSINAASDIGIEKCFLYLGQAPNSKITDPNGILKLTKCLLLGYQEELGAPGLIEPSNGENSFDYSNNLDGSCVAGFNIGVLDSNMGLTKMRNCLFWRNRTGVQVSGQPNLGNGRPQKAGGKAGTYDPGGNTFIDNLLWNIQCNNSGLTTTVDAVGNRFYSGVDICTTESAVFDTIDGAVPAGIKANDRPIDLYGFLTDDILEEPKMPVASGVALSALVAGIVGLGAKMIHDSGSRPYHPSNEDKYHRRQMEKQAERSGNITTL